VEFIMSNRHYDGQMNSTGRPREYENNADKQRAYRQRKKALRNAAVNHDLMPIPLGFDGTPIYYSPTGFVLREPKIVVCGDCGKQWHTVRPDIEVWQCAAASCIFAHPESFDATPQDTLPEGEFE